MNQDDLILVTGATGFLGTQVVRELLQREPHARLALLIRPRPGQTPAQRAEPILQSPDFHSSDSSRVQVYAGDVSEPNCGLGAPTLQLLSAQTTRVIHCAATVRFDHSLEQARHMNVEGTRKMLDFAASIRSLKSFIYVGTAYVAGERQGLIRESELDVGQHFRNTYEQTKAEAEALVRSRLGSLPGVILRPSIIVGDSQTGVTSSFKMLYWPLKIYSRRLWRTVPGYPGAVLDIVPVDYVARAVVQLASDESALSSTVHLCAGPRGSATIAQVAKRAAEYFGVREPRYVDPRIFFAAVRPLLSLALWGKKRRVLVDGAAYRDYFTMRMQFDTTNAERLLGPAGIFPPPVMDYLDRLLHYCVASDWGRKEVSAL
jgi:long-chain acyl-CoA synthetase